MALLHKKIRVGMFFDGTGCNANNIYSINGGKGVDIGTNNSYSGYPSNIYRLFKSYKEINNECEISFPIYVEGVGTKNNAQDSLIAEGFGIDVPFLGVNGYGVFSKYENSIKYTLVKLGEILKKDSAERFSIEFDVFGFSRGAAISRHFTNNIEKRYCDFLKIFENAKKILAKELKINFLGLFDTVATVWTLRNALWSDPHDTGDTNGLDVLLKDELPFSCFQITAMHECRYNFPLHQIPKNGVEITLPGCHSDIGGGYHLKLDEFIFLTKKYYNHPFQKEDVPRKLALEDLNLIKSNHTWESLTSEADVKRLKWKRMKSCSFYQGVSNKNKSGELQFIYGAVMLSAAINKADCPFDIDAYYKQVSIPDDLKPSHQKSLVIMNEAINGHVFTSFTDDELRYLCDNYIHISFDWRNALSDVIMDEETSIDKPVINSTWGDECPNRPEATLGRKVYK
ncbi:T6SS phospholipase effector Tle1-like catalytic domain-containing protein [Hafnia paralvei]|uniref:T6SS phospholipase effector Tle1-like catalytic domain-containing protein n=1 Tax=Hafnia paralvei TaxID=546367 RepID=UPI0010350BED|nr:DUF2235 domain-containing protein [Hafnia paralvei]TBL64052.1 DUF2235 domain-containing protein [Hafnia paralvei]